MLGDMTDLAELTTLRLGGTADRLVVCGSEAELVATVRAADEREEPLLLLGGGSNLVAADAGFRGTVALIRTAGIEREAAAGGMVLHVQAGEPWDPLVARCVDEGLSGFEALSGIPGLVGATPIQNVGAYGGEVSQTIEAVRVYDRREGRVETLAPAVCGFAYRSSVFKRMPERWVVLAVSFRLSRRERSAPVAYGELAHSLGVALGDSPPLSAVRAAVLCLRRAKGMVLDRSDPDTVSAGSFFLNPVLSDSAFERLRARAEAIGVPAVPSYPQPDGSIKTSAAWLIEQSGFHRGYGRPDGIAISSKHTLALTNRGGGTTDELLRLAREIVHGVERTFAVTLEPEPRFVGLSWSDSAAHLPG